MLIAIAIIALIVIAILAFAAMKPNEFSMSRNLDMKATPIKIFAQLNDFKNWGAWSPWEKMDPDLKRTFTGSVSGEGAKYAWIGNKKVGEGNMAITRSVPSSNIVLDLNFLKPFKATNVTEFTIKPNGATSNLNWEMRGNLNLMMKVMHMFMDMDKVVGKDFEAGLANLKGIVER